MCHMILFCCFATEPKRVPRLRSNYQQSSIWVCLSLIYCGCHNDVVVDHYNNYYVMFFYSRIYAHIDSMRNNVFYGGDCDAQQRYISPTILTNVTGDDSIMSEEVFGPILPIILVENVQKAIEFINSRYLAYAVWHVHLWNVCIQWPGREALCISINVDIMHNYCTYIITTQLKTMQLRVCFDSWSHWNVHNTCTCTCI